MGRFLEFLSHHLIEIGSALLVAALAITLVVWRPSYSGRHDITLAPEVSETSEVTLPVTETPLPTETPTLTPTSVPEKEPVERQATTPPTASPTPTYTRTPWPIGWIYSPAGSAYLRDAPNGSILFVASNGMRVKVLLDVAEAAGVAWQHVLLQIPNNGHGGDWNAEGWMAKDLILPESAIPDGKLAFVGGGEQGVYLRAEPGGRVLSVVYPGTIVEILETEQGPEGTWSRVALLDGTQGWISQELLLEPTPTPDPE